MTDKPSDLHVPTSSELDILVILVVNELTRHQFRQIDGVEDMEDGIYIAGARSVDVSQVRSSSDASSTREIAPVFRGETAACQVFLGGFVDEKEAMEVCEEIYGLRKILPLGKNSLLEASHLWMAQETNETVH